MYLPIDKNSEYLSSIQEKSFVDFDFSDESIRGFIQPLLEKRELKILSWDEYISDKPKTDILITRFENANVKSSYNLPVLYQEQIMGYFCIEFTKEICHLSNEDVNRIRNICTQAGIALYHADLYLKAEESTRLKSEFMANISNEFKSPLMEIVNLSKTLYNPNVEYDKQLGYLKHINENASELLALTDDVITISEIESSAFLLHYEHIESSQLIIEVLNAVKSKNGNQDIIINMNLEKINVNADLPMLTKILHILLSEAIKLAKGAVDILIKSELRDDKLVIAIDDAKIPAGVDSMIEDVQKKYISHRISQAGGRLGMSIAKKLVELHNGDMNVGSTSDLGSIFEVVLPQAYSVD
jgi:signal transduction histidine kinase